MVVVATAPVGVVVGLVGPALEAELPLLPQPAAANRAAAHSDPRIDAA
jgi:hypothetical protein